jgi:hypothetical protein
MITGVIQVRIVPENNCWRKANLCYRTMAMVILSILGFF